jgi:hypothetical protein
MKRVVKGLNPSPVYVAVLSDGREVRMSVWQPASAKRSGKWDWEGARNSVLNASATERYGQVMYYRVRNGVVMGPKSNAEAGLTIRHGSLHYYLSETPTFLARDPLSLKEAA